MTAIRQRRLALLATIVLAVVGCGGAPIVANAPAQRPVASLQAKPSAVAVADPQPVVLPRDDGAHRRLTEWWYYTGHLRDGSGGRWGFEFVIFRAERGRFAVSWASHLALTDETGNRFLYGQRSEIGPQVDRRGAALAVGGGTATPAPAADPPGPRAGTAFDLAIRGLDPSRPATLELPAWEMRGGDGRDRLTAAMAPAEAAATGVPGGLGIDLSLVSAKPPALHDRDGWIDFGPAGGSYYYSRTSMAATGSITIDGRTLEVDGTAWFDHQWGDFIAIGGGGWDWFAVNLDDGTDITLSLVRDRDGSYPLVYGTLVSADGRTRHLPREAFTVDVTRHWQSPRSGADYPAGWRISLPAERLTIELEPTVADQELDTRETTGVVYWEGSQRVRAIRDGRPVGGQAYVELTGYGGGQVAAR